jgi:hypothetical protein
MVKKRRRESTIEATRRLRDARSNRREKNDSRDPRRSDREFEDSGCSLRGAWAR